jgi:hypothetical protein
MGSRIMKLTYENLGIENTKEVIELCDSWWVDTSFYSHTKIPFKTKEETWYELFKYAQVIATGGRNEDGQLKSCYVAVISPFIYNGSIKDASELVWCIDKEYRSGRNLIQLLGHIEKICTENKVNTYSLSLPLEENHDRLIEKLKTKDFFVQDVRLVKEISYE